MKSDEKYMQSIYYCEKRLGDWDTLKEIDNLTHYNQFYQYIIEKMWEHISFFVKSEIEKNIKFIQLSAEFLSFNSNLKVLKLEISEYDKFFDYKNSYNPEQVDECHRTNFLANKDTKPHIDSQEKLDSSIKNDQIQDEAFFLNLNPNSLRHTIKTSRNMAKNLSITKKIKPIITKRNGCFSIIKQIIDEQKYHFRVNWNDIYKFIELADTDLEFFWNKYNKSANKNKFFEEMTILMESCIFTGISQILHDEMMGFWSIEFVTIEKIIRKIVNEITDVKKYIRNNFEQNVNTKRKFINVLFYEENYCLIKKIWNLLANEIDQSEVIHFYMKL